MDEKENQIKILQTALSSSQKTIITLSYKIVQLEDRLFKADPSHIIRDSKAKFVRAE